MPIKDRKDQIGTSANCEKQFGQGYHHQCAQEHAGRLPVTPEDGQRSGTQHRQVEGEAGWAIVPNAGREEGAGEPPPTFRHHIGEELEPQRGRHSTALAGNKNSSSRMGNQPPPEPRMIEVMGRRSSRMRAKDIARPRGSSMRVENRTQNAGRAKGCSDAVRPPE